MKSLPPKLSELSKEGFSESDLQEIFDALMHAEQTACRYVNVYLGDEIAFLFAKDQAEADDQIKRWRQQVKRDAIGFVNAGDTWLERHPD